jgi:hypothetical protein
VTPGTTSPAAPMTLHWSPKSPYVRKVMVCAHELDLLPRLQLVRSVAAMLTPNERLMQDNPLSKIPTLVLADVCASTWPNARLSACTCCFSSHSEAVDSLAPVIRIWNVRWPGTP